jgi:hypothetical protein
MNSKKLLRFANTFCSMAMKEELPENSNDTSKILKNLESLESFTARKKYAAANLKHLSSGSSRIVYLTPDKTILKLAKNEKGLAQNEAESNPKMKSKYINKVLKRAKNDAWIEVPYLDKITEKDFKKMTTLSFNEFSNCIRYGLKSVSGNTDKDKPDCFDKVSKHPLYIEMLEIGKKFKLMPGDLSKISSWGSKDNKPILIDAGLTQKVYEDFYES